jgi:hypothetical protein
VEKAVSFRMEESYDIQRLLLLRKLTRALSDHLRLTLLKYLSTISPLLKPKSVLGDYIGGAGKESVKGADKAYNELESLFDKVASARPFGLKPGIKSPIEILNTQLEITPLEYAYEARSLNETKQITIVQPLKWIVSYSGFSPNRLRSLLHARERSVEDLRDFLTHYLVLSTVVLKQPGLETLFSALRFPIRIENFEEFGGLPLVTISAPVATLRPSDSMVIQSTELSGTGLFEEIVSVDELLKFNDPLKDSITELVHGQYSELLV